MRAAFYHGPGDIRIEDVAAPEPGPGEVVVKVLSCGLCGTDLAKYRHRLVQPPVVLGHEIAGEVAEVGQGVQGLKRGDRIVALHHVPCFACHACRHGNFSMCAAWKPNQLSPGGFAEYVRVGARSVQHGVRRIPEGLEPDCATLAEPLACCLRAFKRSPIMSGDTVAVIGAGTAGLLHVQLARFHGAGKVLSVDLIPERLEKAERLGADGVINAAQDDPVEAVMGATDGQGVDLVLTAVGKADVIEQALKMAREGGRVNVFAECPPDSRISLDPNILYHREIVLLGTYSSSPPELDEALGLIVSGKVKVKELISHTMPLGRLQEAFEMALKARDCLKIIIRPNS